MVHRSSAFFIQSAVRTKTTSSRHNWELKSRLLLSSQDGSVPGDPRRYPASVGSGYIAAVSPAPAPEWISCSNYHKREEKCLLR